MGIDAEIQLELKGGRIYEDVSHLLNRAYFYEHNLGDKMPGATHEVACTRRHRDLDTGPFDDSAFLIFSTLWVLLRSPEVERVWYGGDCGQLGPLQTVNLLEVSAAIRKCVL